MQSKKAQSICVPEPKSITPPNMAGTGCTIYGTEQKAECSPIDENVIPIFPVRFGFSGDTLLGLRDGTPVPPVPTTIHDMPGYELFRIRRGYIFIIDDQDRWHIFWYETNWKDNNGSTVLVDTPDSEQKKLKRIQGRAPYTFNKIKWDKKLFSRGPWELDLEDRIYPFAFVRNDVSTCWIAYSEERWPSYIFERLEVDKSLREKLMTKLDTQSRSGDMCAPLEDLGKFAHNFKDKEIDYVNDDDYVVENIFRYTNVADESVKYVTRYAAAGKGVVTGVYDPAANQLDINKLIASQEYIAAKFSEEYQYPITIGNYIRKLQEKDEKYKYLEKTPIEKRRDSYRSDHTAYNPSIVKEQQEQYKEGLGKPRGRRNQNPLEKWIKQDALHIDFDKEFGKFEAVFKRHDEITYNLKKSLIQMAEQDEFGSLNYYGNTIKDIKSLDERSFDSSEIIRYLAVYYFSSFRQLKDTHLGTEFVKQLLSHLYDDAKTQDEEDKSIAVDFKTIRSQLEFLKITLKMLKKQAELIGFDWGDQQSTANRLSIAVGANFKVSVISIFNEIGHVVSYRFYRRNSGRDRWDPIQHITSKVIKGVELDSSGLENNLRKYFENTARYGGEVKHRIKYKSNTGAITLESSVSGEKRTQQKNKIAKVENFYSEIDFGIDNESMRNHVANSNYTITQNGVGMFLCTLTMMANMQNYNAANRSKTTVGRISSDPRVVIAHAFSEGVGNAYSAKLAKIAKTATPREVIASQLQKVFYSKSFVSLAGSTADELAGSVVDDLARNAGRLNVGVGHAVAQNMIKGVSVVSILLSLGQVMESIEIKDNTALIGNSLVAIGNTMLLFSSVLGPVGFAAAIVALTIGTLMTFYGYDDNEKWIKDSFWGVSSEYWGKDREDIQVNINESRIVFSELKSLNSTDKNVVSLNKFEEFLLKKSHILKAFEYEVRWYYDLSSALKLADIGGNQIEVQCSSIIYRDDVDQVDFSYVVNFEDQIAPMDERARIRRQSKREEIMPIIVNADCLFIEKGTARIIFEIDQDKARALSEKYGDLEFFIRVSVVQMYGNVLRDSTVLKVAI
jgi:hypothetical protein